MPPGLPRTRTFVGVKTHDLPIRAFFLEILHVESLCYAASVQYLHMCASDNVSAEGREGWKGERRGVGGGVEGRREGGTVHQISYLIWAASGEVKGAVGRLSSLTTARVCERERERKKRGRIKMEGV